MKTFIIITGPRHAGKTTLCETAVERFSGMVEWICLDGLYNRAVAEAGENFHDRLEALMMEEFQKAGPVVVSDGACYSYSWLWDRFLSAVRKSCTGCVEIHGIHLLPPEPVRFQHYLEVKEKYGHEPQHNLDKFSKVLLPPPDENFMILNNSSEAIIEIGRIIDEQK